MARETIKLKYDALIEKIKAEYFNLVKNKYEKYAPSKLYSHIFLKSLDVNYNLKNNDNDSEYLKLLSDNINTFEYVDIYVYNYILYDKEGRNVKNMVKTKYYTLKELELNNPTNKDYDFLLYLYDGMEDFINNSNNIHFYYKYKNTENNKIYNIKLNDMGVLLFNDLNYVYKEFLRLHKKSNLINKHNMKKCPICNSFFQNSNKYSRLYKDVVDRNVPYDRRKYYEYMVDYCSKKCADKDISNENVL